MRLALAFRNLSPEASCSTSALLCSALLYLFYTIDQFPGSMSGRKETLYSIYSSLY